MADRTVVVPSRASRPASRGDSASCDATETSSSRVCTHCSSSVTPRFQPLPSGSHRQHERPAAGVRDSTWGDPSKFERVVPGWERELEAWDRVWKRTEREIPADDIARFADE